MLKWYCASRLLSERVAVEAQNKSGAKWPLSIVCPPTVYDPMLHHDKIATDTSNATRSVKGQYGMIGWEDGDLSKHVLTTHIDMRNLADVVWRVITQKKEGRFLVAGDDYDWQKGSIMMRKIRLELHSYIPIGFPDKHSMLDQDHAQFDVSKSVKELGMTCRAQEDTWGDLLDYFVNTGAVKV